MSASLLLAADDPAGWTAAKWGMSPDQVIAALGPGAKLLPSGVVSLDLDLAGVKFGAGAHFDKDGHLETVDLLPSSLADASDALFRNLEELLVEKYGHPWKTTEEKNVTQDQWTFATTVVTLTRERHPMIIELLGEKSPGALTVNIEYKRKSPDLNKL
jgi:hypothetical protein